ncbi:MAG: hypothetical protein ACM3NT_10095 [Methylocystaceae bacterium]
MNNESLIISEQDIKERVAVIRQKLVTHFFKRNQEAERIIGQTRLHDFLRSTPISFDEDPLAQAASLLMEIGDFDTVKRYYQNPISEEFAQFQCSMKSGKWWYF